MSGMTQWQQTVISPIEGEEWVLLLAMEEARHRGLDRVQFESDSKVLIEAIHMKRRGNSEFLSIVHDILSIMSSFPNFEKSSNQRGRDWLEENLAKVVGNGRNTLFWRDPWVGGESLYKLFDRLYDISLDKDSLVSDMLIVEEGVRRIKWRWRRNLFQWENELVEVCNSLVMGVERKEEEADSWQWGGESYTVKNAYLTLIEGECEATTWVGDVWSPLIPLRLSMLAWRLFQNRFPTKENLRRRGVDINSSIFCVGGCGELETEEHLFFNCPILSMAWRKIVSWLGISVAFVKGGYDHYLMFKGLISGSLKVKERLGILWLSTADAICSRVFAVNSLSLAFALLVGCKCFGCSAAYGPFLYLQRPSAAGV
ncbi:hypothetical protein TSUD_415060 [Trifolium subterraneum]|uniref:Reverse transcriptase zinc-binding domain-containing protein n=1 Tax=Trifolium subterraneum TaxID=3900 RepID=A0A2Z6PL75_TRISU|nr:hypothetical protein TSUD_415060 [Trifolium subterraneum]